MSIIETHDIAGMTCDHCARAVRAEVSAIDGVTDVDVDLNSGVVVPLPRPLGPCPGGGDPTPPGHGFTSAHKAQLSRRTRFTSTMTTPRPWAPRPGSVVVMRAGAKSFAHEHAEVEDEDGRPVLALPGQTFGPELDVHAEFDTPGVYQLWGQFRLADGDVVTVPFTVEAS